MAVLSHRISIGYTRVILYTAAHLANAYKPMATNALEKSRKNSRVRSFVVAVKRMDVGVGISASCSGREKLYIRVRVATRASY